MTVSALEFDVLTEHLGVELVPLVLKVPSPGRTDVERSRLVRQAWSGLAERGLGGPMDVDPELVRLLHLLDRPSREIDGRVWTAPDHAQRIFAAARDSEAVLAVLQGNSLTLQAADESGLARHAVSVLPRRGPGPGRSVTMPANDFATAATAPGPLDRALSTHGVRADDARAVAEMITPLTARGQFGAATRDRWGRRVRNPRVISWFDTEAGRYLQVRTPPPDPWTTISPADPRALLHQVAALLD
ncbi:ESX secretion-associated protein EspG [Actinokineospora sp. NBRC 105648]|uniref:ESX secretion-associated protein EspG n=1 Tax=Actinokineospora sp. NBRC 105648 TaxID=3032206 RepID=UPI002556E251|nr:ESX secretion-associated protein EspG [Actinokineospora sp. NBRC 105648]